MGNSQSAPEPPVSQQKKKDSETEASACPVDPAAREAWLVAAVEHRQQNAPPPPSLPPSHPFIPPTPSTTETTTPPPPRIAKHRPLGSDRVISTIPRSASAPDTTTPSPSSRPTSPNPDLSLSPNAQTSTPAVSSAGNWIYPSERMFFDAMKRKQHDPAAEDMAIVVPIHNAVNERAWTLIKRWEAAYAAAENAKCQGPRLRSFSGDSSKLTPRARWNTWCGYERPFDRHDWVVERCAGAGAGEGEKGKGEGGGRMVEYVIDFYRGRESAKGGGREGGLNFYLDVRPKLNSWEGWRMRTRKIFGL